MLIKWVNNKLIAYQQKFNKTRDIFFAAHKTKPTSLMYEPLLNRSSNNTNFTRSDISRKTTCAATILVCQFIQPDIVYNLLFFPLLFLSYRAHKTEHGESHTFTRYVCMRSYVWLLQRWFACMPVYIYASHEFFTNILTCHKRSFAMIGSGPKGIQNLFPIFEIN